jgi:hypothetical protein
MHIGPQIPIDAVVEFLKVMNVALPLTEPNMTQVPVQVTLSTPALSLTQQPPPQHDIRAPVSRPSPPVYLRGEGRGERGGGRVSFAHLNMVLIVWWHNFAFNSYEHSSHPCRAEVELLVITGGPDTEILTRSRANQSRGMALKGFATMMMTGDMASGIVANASDTEK